MNKNKKQRVSIQILNSNRIGELDICLTSLINQSFIHWDLIILDESDNAVINHKHVKDILTYIKCNGHGVIYKYQNPAMYNIGKNRNACYKLDEFKNELIIRIDDDSFCDKDYVKILVDTYNKLVKKGIKVGAVGGIVPVFGRPQVYKKVPKIFNKVIANNEGDLLSIGDDGGMNYNESKTVLSHHLRSSFLFTRTAFEEIGGHPLEYGFNGFREETVFTFKMLFNGYKLYTNTGAKCYHLQAMGGSRNFSQEEYKRLVMVNDEHFRNWAKYCIGKYGNVFDNVKKLKKMVNKK